MLNAFGQKFASERTEQDILAQAPIKVQLGGKEYDIKPLPIRKNAEWRKAMVDVLNDSGKAMNVQVTDLGGFMQGLMAAHFSFPEKVIDLVRLYAPALPWEVILSDESTVTDEEIVIAYSRIMVVAYPFSNLLGMMTLAAQKA